MFCTNFYQAIVELKLVGLTFGLISLYCFGFWVNWLIKKIKIYADESPPEGIQPERWEKIIHIPKNSQIPIRWLGNFERIFFFLSFWIGSPELIAGWLAFKLGSKWEIWHSIIKVPTEIQDTIDPLEYMAARNRWGSSTLQRWLVGTIANVLVALVCVGIGKFVHAII